MNTETPDQKKTLGSLISTLQRAEADLIEFSPEMVEDLKEKVDAYKYVDEKFDAEIFRLNEQMQLIAEVKKSLANKKAKLRELMAYHMKENKFDKLPGQMFQVSLVERADVELTLPEANAETYLLYGPEIIERSYSWKAVELKKKVKSDPENYKHFGNIVHNYHVKFSAKKDLTK